MKNIVLLGFMGSGKSCVGQILAERLGRQFIDIDALVEQELGMSIADFFAQFGEPAFRDRESAAVEAVAAQSGAVISTGGGVVMLFGVGDAPIYFLLTFAAVWPIMLNTSAGVRTIDPNWLQLGASLSATRVEMLARVIIPAVLGHVLTGLRLAIGIVWIVLVPCEMLGVSKGLGYFILDTRDRLAYSELMAAVLFIGLLGWLLDSAARRLHKRWAHGKA